MKNLIQFSAVGCLTLALSYPVVALSADDVEVRLQKLERMADNPVLMQLNRNLSDQRREIQELHDQIDRIKHQHEITLEKANRRYQETDDRLNALETLQKTGKLPEASADATASSDAVVKNDAESLKPDSKPVREEEPMAQMANQVETHQMEPTEGGSNSSEGATKQDSLSGQVVTRAATEVEKLEYQKAFALMRASKYPESIKAFEAFQNKYPQSDLASNAAYWAGEGYLIKQNYKSALEAFSTVIDHYASSPKLADAQLRAADSLMSLNRVAEAKKLYQTVINTRSTSQAAQKAAKRLENLK